MSNMPVPPVRGLRGHGPVFRAGRRPRPVPRCRQGSNAILPRDILPREGDRRAMPQDFTVTLTDEQVEALRQLAAHRRESPGEALHRAVREGTEKPKDPKPIPKDRLETFIDGVFAVALTLLVVEAAKDIPSVVGDWQEWWPDLWQKLIIFVYSFWVVGIYWISNHNELNMLEELGGPNTRMRFFLHVNLLFVLFIVFIPFSAALLGNNVKAPLEIAEEAKKSDYGVLALAVCSDERADYVLGEDCSTILGPSTEGFWRMRFPFLVYAINLFLVSFTFQWVWSYIRSEDAGAFDQDHAKDKANTTWRNWLILIWAGGVAICGILFSVVVIQFMLVAVPLFYTASMLYAARLKHPSSTSLLSRLRSSLRSSPLLRLIRGR
jgi:uncharacterized membrane protein